MKKITLFLFALMCSASVFAHDLFIDNVYYVSLGGDSVAVSFRGLRSNEVENEYVGDVVIPATVQNFQHTLRVTSIRAEAFRGCKGLKSVTIGENIRDVGHDAFELCDSLTKVTWNAVTCRDFGGINADDNPFGGGPKITEITFGEKVKYIPAYLFRAHSAHTLTIPDNVDSIGSYSLSGAALKTVVIGNGVQSIGDYAFSYSSKLQEVTIGESVKRIGDRTFWSCDSLTSLVWNAINCSDFSGPIFRSTPIASVTLGNKVEHIPAYAFNNLHQLTSVQFSNSIVSIGKSAFFACYILPEVNLPNSVTTIGEGAFGNCYGLEKPIYNDKLFVLMHPGYEGAYTIPDGITTIFSGAFTELMGLTAVMIPNTVTTIGDGAFAYCLNLNSANLPNSVTSVGGGIFCESSIPDPIYNDKIFAYMPMGYEGAYTVPDGITTIAAGAFVGDSLLTSVELPKSMDSIGHEAFVYCLSLDSLRLHSFTPPRLGEYVFDAVPVADVVVTVPCGSARAYAATAGWDVFTNYVEDDNCEEALITEVNLSLDFAKATDYAVGKPEIDAQLSLLQQLAVATDAKYEIDDAVLIYIENGGPIFVEDMQDLVSDGRNYCLYVALLPKAGNFWPSDLATIDFYLNNGPVTIIHSGLDEDWGLFAIDLPAPLGSTTTGVETPYIASPDQVRKFLKNGTIYILYNGVKYTLMGQPTR